MGKRSSIGLTVAAAAVFLLGSSGACAPAASSNAASPSPINSQVQVNLEDQFIAVVSRVSPSVVAIQADNALGSGVIFDRQGHVVTNAHVVAGSSSYRVFLANGASYPATLTGAFTADDLAVLKIDASGLQPAEFGDSDQVRVGSIVMAIGSPLGLQGSVTEGIVSAVGRQVSEPNGVALPPLIQTSASINPGNSGGALVDLDGRVIGIPTLAAQDPQAGGTAPGIGFAIPSNIAGDIATQLIQSGRVSNSHRAYLGVQAANASGGKGAVVYSVVAAGPADRAGIRANDVIIGLAGRQIVDQPSLASALASLQPGATVNIDVVRPDGSAATLRLTLGELPG